MDIAEFIKPYKCRVNLDSGIIEGFDNHIERKLSSMKNHFLDVATYEEMLKEKDVQLYEVFEKTVPEVSGELKYGLSIVHPGKVGNEYFMTKGHFHTILETGELYHCLKGQGYMMMETMDGNWGAEEMLPGNVVYVPGGWAHRSINTGKGEDLVTLFCYPADAGHDYATIGSKGFRNLLIEENGKPLIIGNPKWKKVT